jgi:polyhydroxyalkanoate synthesis regulator phasin
MSRIQKLAVGLVVLVAVAGTGSAIAAAKLRSPQEESRAVVNDAARELGVSPERLTNALKTALKNRIDEAVADGRMTKAEGDRLKARIDESEVPLFGPGFRHRGGPFGLERGFGFRHESKLEAAAKYLGLSESALREQLRAGKTLAEVARARDKSVDGLVDALVAEARERIEQRVRDGSLTREEADRCLADLEARVTDFVNGRLPRFGPRLHRPGGSGFFGGEPPRIIGPTI